MMMNPSSSFFPFPTLVVVVVIFIQMASPVQGPLHYSDNKCENDDEDDKKVTNGRDNTKKIPNVVYSKRTMRRGNGERTKMPNPGTSSTTLASTMKIM